MYLSPRDLKKLARMRYGMETAPVDRPDRADRSARRRGAERLITALASALLPLGESFQRPSSKAA